MDRVRLVPLLVWTNSLHFRFRLNPSLKGGQAHEKITASEHISQDLVRVITPVQEAGHP